MIKYIFLIIMSFSRYLASGTSYKRLQNKYRISKKTLSKLIKETCGIIWKVLAPTEMAAPNKESWKRISEGFKDNANFPHCLGALDGKHIRIQCPGIPALYTLIIKSTTQSFYWLWWIRIIYLL